MCPAGTAARARVRARAREDALEPGGLILLACARRVVVAVAVRPASDQAVAARTLAQREREGDQEGDGYRYEHLVVLPVGVALCLHLTSIEARAARRLCEVDHTGNR